MQRALAKAADCRNGAVLATPLLWMPPNRRPINNSSCMTSSFNGGSSLRHKFALASTHVRWHMGGNPGGTVDEQEVRKFGAVGKGWWERNGPMKALHSYNLLRVPFLKNMLLQHLRPANNSLQGMKAVDVGCGGGILAEDLCRLGLDVTGIDASPENIAIASEHAEKSGLLEPRGDGRSSSGLGRLEYRHITADALSRQGGAEAFDVVVCSEVIEHVSDLKEMVRQLGGLLRPQGAMLVTTINRTNLSYALSIVAAEHILGLVPPGTHEWNKYVTPQELTELLSTNNMKVERVMGAAYNHVIDQWISVPDTSINYLVFATKNPYRQVWSEQCF